MHERALKKHIKDLLRGDDLEQILAELRTYPPKQLVNPLISSLFSTEEVMKWHAVTAIGEIVQSIRKYGFVRSVAINEKDGWLLLGHGTTKALAWMLGRPEPRDTDRIAEARRLFDEGDHLAAADAWPHPFGHERRMCRALAKARGDARRAHPAALGRIRGDIGARGEDRDASRRGEASRSRVGTPGDRQGSRPEEQTTASAATGSAPTGRPG